MVSAFISMGTKVLVNSAEQPGGGLLSQLGDAFRDEAQDYHRQRDGQDIRRGEKAQLYGAAGIRLGVDAHRLRDAKVVDQRDGGVERRGDQDEHQQRTAGVVERQQ